MKIHSPHPFSERILVFGGGGAGKTNAGLSIADHCPVRVHVVESDLSSAWQRALYLEYPEAADRVQVWVADDWVSYIESLEKAESGLDDERGDWLIVDSSSPSWDWVQEWAAEKCFPGEGLPSLLADLKGNTKGARDYAKAKSDMMNGFWEIAKKEYRRFWRVVQGWRGNLLLTAEAKSLGRDMDESERRMYGHIGCYPGGQAQVRYATSTTLFLANEAFEKWTMTTVKDRNRGLMDREEVTDFALDYLMGTAGWGRMK